MKEETRDYIIEWNSDRDFELLFNKGNTLYIKDLQLEEILEVLVMEWLEKIWEYYTIEAREYFPQSFNTFEKKELIWYYENIIRLINIIENEREITYA